MQERIDPKRVKRSLKKLRKKPRPQRGQTFVETEFPRWIDPSGVAHNIMMYE